MNCPFKVLLFALLISAVIVPCGAFMGEAPLASQTAKPPAASQTAKPAAAPQNEEEESPPGYEEEYNCYQDATKETDALERGKRLLKCIVDHPKSTLMPNFVAEYKRLLSECLTNKKYEELEKLAEDWLKLHANDPETLGTTAYIVEAADKLGHDEKYIQRAIELYKMKPFSSLAVDIAVKYLKMGNKAKYIEWIETAVKLPENESNFLLRFYLVQLYWEAKDSAKTLEWAQATLNAADRVTDPSSDTRKQIAEKRHACYNAMGGISLKDKKYSDAIKAYKQALRIKEYAEGYYYIGLCLHSQQKYDDAMRWYAKTELWCKKNAEKSAKECAEFEPKAKENLEKIYKPNHDNTTFAIEKVYDKAEKQTNWLSDEN
jgi:tetratricopeptide (TPR) repeat protein